MKLNFDQPMLIRGWFSEKEKINAKEKQVKGKYSEREKSRIRNNSEIGQQFLKNKYEDNIVEGCDDNKTINKKFLKEQDKENCFSVCTLKYTKSQGTLAKQQNTKCNGKGECSADASHIQRVNSKSPNIMRQKLSSKEELNEEFKKNEQEFLSRQNDYFSEKPEYLNEKYDSDKMDIRFNSNASEIFTKNIYKEGRNKLLSEQFDKLDTEGYEKYPCENLISQQWLDIEGIGLLEEMSEVEQKERTKRLEELLKQQRGQYEQTLRKFREQVRQMKKEQAEQNEREKVDKSIQLDKIRELQKQIKEREFEINQNGERDKKMIEKFKFLNEKERNLQEKENGLFEKEQNLKNQQNTLNQIEKGFYNREANLKNKEINLKNKEMINQQKELELQEKQILFSNKEDEIEKENTQYKSDFNEIILAVTIALKQFSEAANPSTLKIKKLLQDIIFCQNKKYNTLLEEDNKNECHFLSQWEGSGDQAEISFQESSLTNKTKENISLKWDLSFCEQEKIVNPFETRKDLNLDPSKDKQFMLKNHQESISSQINSKIMNKQMVVALFDFNAVQEKDLSIQKGDKIQIINKNDNGWWVGQMNDKIGYFPSNYVEDFKK